MYARKPVKAAALEVTVLDMADRAAPGLTQENYFDGNCDGSRAIGRSIVILRKTWGEALVGQFGLGLFMLLLALPGILLLAAGAVLCVAASPLVGGMVLALAVLYLLFLGAVGAALDGIFLSALYQYAAHGAAPSGFDAYSLEHAFRSKKK